MGEINFRYSLKRDAFDITTHFSCTTDAVKQRNEEISNLRRELRERDETIQQREIEISCLRGQVNRAMGRVTRAILELDSVKDDGDDSDTLTFSGSDLIDDVSEVYLSDILAIGEDTMSLRPQPILPEDSERTPVAADDEEDTLQITTPLPMDDDEETLMETPIPMDDYDETVTSVTPTPPQPHPSPPAMRPPPPPI